MIITISILAFVCTLLGGLFALKFKDKLHLILGFSAGAVVGVAFFDLIPEALELAGTQYDPATVMSIVAIGFLAYMILDRLFVMHNHTEEDHDHAHAHRGNFGAGSLSFHSFLDGIGIGLAFQVSNSLGVIVAIAVLAHDFSDGINTVGMIIKSGGSKKDAFKWLCLDAIAPVLGVVSTLFFSVSEVTLGIILSVFSGFFLYIGASDLLPESHHNHPTIWTTVATIIGLAVMFVAIKLAGI
jgi:ZIP family zinc transporter